MKFTTANFRETKDKVSFELVFDSGETFKLELHKGLDINWVLGRMNKWSIGILQGVIKHMKSTPTRPG